MARLEELKPGVIVNGLIPGSLVTIIDVKWYGSVGIELTYKDTNGRLGRELLYRNSESLVMLGGRRIAYDEVSPPNPKGAMLLLTGLGSKRLAWYKQLEAFGRTFRTIALDFRDTGDSDLVSEPYTLGDLADEAVDVLLALGVQRAHVVGISMGGAVALHTALRHPESVEKLVVIATTPGGKAHVPASPEMLALVGQPDPQLEIGERVRRTYARVAAPGYFDNHP